MQYKYRISFLGNFKLIEDLLYNEDGYEAVLPNSWLLNPYILCKDKKEVDFLLTILNEDKNYSEVLESIV